MARFIYPQGGTMPAKKPETKPAEAEKPVEAAKPEQASEPPRAVEQPETEAVYFVEIPGCLMPGLLVLAASEQDAIDCYTSEYGIIGYAAMPKVKLTEEPKSAADLPRLPESPQA